ncbi:hypothetical protein F441_13768 [Phytophthora nicotianae CJ01A1]|nr:hypothetical protein F441_13768 [Phytophthora nicotianae CJ01A1]
MSVELLPKIRVLSSASFNQQLAKREKKNLTEGMVVRLKKGLVADNWLGPLTSLQTQLRVLVA